MDPKRNPRSQPADATPFFGRVKVTQRHKDKDEALRLLTRAAEEVQAVMARRSWHIGSLEEFLPQNPALLGLNVNRRQVIKVRLRRNGSLTFLPYEDILGTLLHELCHVVFAKHDKDFFALLDELWTEVETGNSRLPPPKQHVPFTGNGKAAGGARKPTSQDGVRRRRLEAAEKRRKVERLGRGSGQKLGGSSATPATPEELRRRIRAAAERRRMADTICGTAEDREIVDLVEEDDDMTAEAAPTATRTPNTVEGILDEATLSEPGAFRSSRRLGLICCRECQVANKAERLELERDEDDEAEVAVNFEVGFLAEILEFLKASRAVPTLRTLEKIVLNLAEHPSDPKFRRVNLLTKDGRTLLDGEGCALSFLNVLGFSPDGGQRLVAASAPDLQSELQLVTAAAEAIACTLRSIERQQSQESPNDDDGELDRILGLCVNRNNRDYKYVF